MAAKTGFCVFLNTAFYGQEGLKAAIQNIDTIFLLADIFFDKTI